ncbi:hypothetical protein CL620_04865, partial [archaeon]|nr:hypothetical protein [archaeon]
MAEDDIYGNKKRYEFVVNSLSSITKKPVSKKYKYYCKNQVNTKYFDKLIINFDVKDLSYIRRVKLLYLLKRITYIIEKDLKKCDRDDINKIVAFFHTTHKTVESKRDFIKDLKCTWRVLFPEKDQEGRVDETITPYPIRHLSRRIDRSKQKRRNDKLTWDEFQCILRFFEKDPQIQAYLALAVESLGRPQEMLFTKIRDYNFYDNYAKIWISEHGKEGTGFLQCIDSYPYVMRWYNLHPFKDDPDA